MKVALLGDVHANLPALETVLAHAYRQEIDAIWNIGDWVGYNAFPNEVIATLRQAGAISIVGNYDLKVLKFKKKRQQWQQTKAPLKYRAFEWADQTLTPENRRYLADLPQEIILRFKSTSVLLTHGSPASNEEWLTPDTPTERLRELAQLAGTQVVVCGHSHRPFARQVAGVWFINPGSVGRPDDGDWRAAYAILTLTGKSIAVEHFRLDYDIDRAVTALQQAGIPPEFGHMLRLGRNLDEVQAGAGGNPTPSPSPTK
jgi:putative phosphoesterase